MPYIRVICNYNFLEHRDQRKCYWRLLIINISYQFAEYFSLGFGLAQIVVDQVVQSTDLLLYFLKPFGVGG